jgi:hypothetical protein
MSNWIAVNANLTKDGHPIVVMGPQTSYFVPQLLWEFAVTSHGGTPLDFNGRGIDFAMLPYIEIGRGVDYAWSATSGESDLIDTRVSKLCNLDGSAATRWPTAISTTRRTARAPCAARSTSAPTAGPRCRRRPRSPPAARPCRRR